MDFNFIYHLTTFILTSIFIFTTPGYYIIHKFNLYTSFWERIFLGTTLGLVLFSLLTYLQLFINLPYFALLIILLVNYFALKDRKSLKRNIFFFTKKQLTILLITFFVGIAGQLVIIAPSGLTINGDLLFWSSHGHDGTWHIALMNELQKGYPLQNPSFAGEKLVNYHFFSDLAPAFFNYYFNIPKLDLYFRFFPFLFSILLGSSVFLVTQRLTKSFGSSIWAVIFTYSAGSFGYIVTYLQNRTIGGESLFWATQIYSSIGNPPQIAAFIIFLLFIFLLILYVKSRNNIPLALTCIFVAGSLITFKVYGGIVLLGSLFILSCFQIVYRKFDLFLIFIGSLLFSLALYLPNSAKTSGFLILEPWWFIRTMVVASDKLNWIDLELRRQTYLSEHNYKRVFQLELMAFTIFLFGNLGMRLLGMISFIKSSFKIFNDPLYLFFTSTILISFIAPLLFLQKGVAPNTIQFMQYSILLMGIFAGITTSQIINKVRSPLLQVVISVIIITLCVPTQISQIYDLYAHPPHAKVITDEIIALEFLRKIPTKAVIVSAPYDQNLSLGDAIPNIWDWFDTSYIAAFTEKLSYVSDYEQLDIMGYSYQGRIALQQKLFLTHNTSEFMNILHTTNANYIYFPKILAPKVDLNQTTLKKIFSNNTIEIWKIN